MTDAKLQKARAAAEKAQQELAALEAVEAERQAQRDAERAEREREYAQRIVNNWHDEDAANGKAERDARGKFLELVSQEPWFVAFAEYRAYRHKRGHLIHAVQRAQTVLDVPVTGLENRMYDSTLLDDIVSAAEERAAAVIAADFADELEAKREAYVNGE